MDKRRIVFYPEFEAWKTLYRYRGNFPCKTLNLTSKNGYNYITGDEKETTEMPNQKAV